MTSYTKLKKLDEESLQKLQEGTGPSDQCICSLLAPATSRKSLAKSLKKALGFSSKKKEPHKMGQAIDVPLNYAKGGKGLVSTKEVVKRMSSCGKCGCDDNQLVLKHSYANIRITSPDISSVCPCPTDCLPDKEKLKNNIKVIVERVETRSYPALNTQSLPQLDSDDGTPHVPLA